VWQRAGAKEERVVLQTPAAPAKRLRGAYTGDGPPEAEGRETGSATIWRPRTTTAVDGAQRGVSPTQAIKVFSAAEHAASR